MNEDNKLNKTTIILCGIIIILLLFLGYLGYQSKIQKDNFDTLSNYSNSLNDTIVHLKNNTVSKPQVFITPDAFKQVVDQNDSYKKQLALMQIKVSQVKNITTVSNKIIFRDTIKIHDTIAGIDIKRDSIVFRSVLDSEYIVATQKNFVFKRPEFNILIRHTNPDIQTIGIESLTVKPERKFLQSGWLKFGIGFLAAAYLFHR